MIYYKIEKDENGIYLIEDKYDKRYALKTETVFSQCNGYLGVRASYETKMLQESRGMFVDGLYHKASEHEVTELVNCPDLISMDIYINGESVNLDSCKMNSFRRTLNLINGELDTSVNFDLEKTKDICIKTRRFSSFHNPHLICHQLEVTTKDNSILKIITGINGQITNSGVSHFEKVITRVFDKNYMYTENTCNDGQVFKAMTCCSSKSKVIKSPVFGLKRRSVYGEYEYFLNSNEVYRFEKYSYVDSGTENITNYEKMKQELIYCEEVGYKGLFKKHIEAYNKLWKYARINIDGATLEEEAAITFAQYHLFGMTPMHSYKSSVGAKGLTGEGYKGHVFWDTEIFIMPFFTLTFPNIAKNLLKFRYLGLEGARKKAKENGYKGAMYPWEVAKSGKEETPLYAALNIHTGKAEKVWSGIKEHHVTADIIYALWNYYKITKDEKFLQDYGYEMLIETAIFWCNRAKYVSERNRYEIFDVIGPDEYTEHIDNNAYTNYMAAKNVKIACKAVRLMQEKSPLIYQKLNKKYNLEEKIKEWKFFIENIYLPKANNELIIPQDDTFLTKKEIKNIEKYKNSDIKQLVLQDYSRDEIINMQVLKQADVVMLLNMLPHLFDAEIVKKNVLYYEKRTIHDSSLSYSTHAIACANIGEIKLAYNFFKKAMEIDLNTNYKDSADGIHSASLGGIINSVIQGFAGIRYNLNYIEINPHMPNHWKQLEFYLMIEGQYVNIKILDEKIIISPENKLNNSISFKIKEQIYNLEDIELEVRLGG